ncbi:MAG: exodeoxyribonuclease VII small subunit [Clostridiaceae bacterium]|nr:exodeoxyribonuclease VII small subunit [Clostridiaceae bacterium]
MAKKFVFEEAVSRLEEIVKQLEKGDVPLDKSLELFEEGTGLIKKCGSALDKAEQRVTLLVKTDNGPEETSFEEEE